jgi:hypothetical protein
MKFDLMGWVSIHVFWPKPALERKFRLQSPTGS